jgi:FixJ family two-component response regulator
MSSRLRGQRTSVSQPRVTSGTIGSTGRRSYFECAQAQISPALKRPSLNVMGCRKLILVLDDDPSVLRAVERLLKVHGFDVETFLTIDSFMERANLRAATCLVLDINLNGSSGIDLKRKLSDAGIPLPVIFITARDEDVTRRAALSAGCVAYLSKPFSSKDLVDAIEASRTQMRLSRILSRGQCASSR